MILVTGVNGFVGKHLVNEFANRDIEIIGVGRSEAEPHEDIKDQLKEYYQCDVANQGEVDALPLHDISCVINLAGLANVGASFDNPELYMRVNVGVLSVLGNSLLSANPSARMIAVSTGAVYDPLQPMPLTEESQTIQGGSPYSKSKLAMEEAAKELTGKGLDTIVVRPFNHIGPGQDTGFLVPDLVEKLKNVDEDDPAISVGNLETKRDYTDVRDIARAYADLALAESLEHRLYNVCSDISLSGKEILESLKKIMGIVSLKLEVDESKIRPADPAEITGSAQRLRSETGWEPKFSIEQTLTDIQQSTRELEKA